MGLGGTHRIPSAGTWENHVLGRVAEIQRIRRISAAIVADLEHPDAWLILGALH